MHNSKKAFTLVELIVVIVILAILATIAFLSFSSQSASARDSTRLSDMSNIAKGLSVFNATSGSYPKPDSNISILASGATIGFQGYAGSTVLNMIKISNGGKDPLDTSTYYTYYTSAGQNKFQILGFLEDGSNAALSLLPPRLSGEGWGEGRVFADPSSYSGRYLITKGDSLGILLNSNTLVPIQTSGTGADLMKSQSGSTYKAIFGNESSGKNISGTGADILQGIYAKNPAASATDDSLVGFWDMSTTTSNGGMVQIKDLSKYGNNGTCYNYMTPVSCGSTSGPKLSGNYMTFDGIDDWIRVNPSASLNLTGGLTMIAKITANTFSGSPGKGILRKGNSHPFGYELVVTASGYIEPWYCYGSPCAGTGSIGVLSSSLMLTGSTYVVGGTNDMTANKVKAFLNGTFTEGPSGTGSLFSSSEFLMIGSWGTYAMDRYWDGTMDEIRIYNRVLSDSEINSIYNIIK